MIELYLEQWWQLGWSIAAIVVVIEVMLIIKRFKDKAYFQTSLERSKKETQEIAQLSLHSPHPEFQVLDNGNIVFANLATLEIFPTLDKDGLEHPLLRNIEGVESREIYFDDKIYQQTIKKTLVNGQLAYVIYCYDITDRKNYENEISKAYDHAEEQRQLAEAAKEARGDFLANMSHELRTPMNGIIGLSGILCEMDLKKEQHELIEAVHNSARNLLILLNDILDFSKIEAGELSIENIPYDIRKTVGQIESLQKPLAVQKNLTMEVSIADNVPDFLIGDPSRLQQILNNLVGNALKFTEKGTVSLFVSGERHGDENYNLNIQVSDTGIGIPKEKQDSIFEKFQQADSSTSRKYGGTGLGLSITKDLVDLIGGEISIKSAEGEGSTFSVTLYAHVSDQNMTTTHHDSDKNLININTSVSVMIVDDHPINLLFLRKTLTKYGLDNITEASSGHQALNLFSKNNYDLILMDCQMPEIDGLETSKLIREAESADAAPVIIAVTADAMKGAEQKCLNAGMDDYISKPIDKDKLLSLLQLWIPASDQNSDQNLLESDASDQVLEVPFSGRNEIIDWDHLDEFTDQKIESENEIFKILSDNLKMDMDLLHKYFKSKKYDEWIECVHKLYGACSHVGAHDLAKACNEGQELNTDNVQRVTEVHKNILTEYNRLVIFLRERGIS